MPAQRKTFKLPGVIVQKAPGVAPYQQVALYPCDMTTSEREGWMIFNEGREVARAVLLEGTFVLGAYDHDGNFHKLLEKSNLPGVKNHFTDTEIALECLQEGLAAVRAFLTSKQEAVIANDNSAPNFPPRPA